MNKYTAFRNDAGRICFLHQEAESLAQFMEAVNRFYLDGWDEDEAELIAWAPEATSERRGRLKCDDLCAESLAAGRLLKFVNGAWMAVKPSMTPTLDKMEAEAAAPRSDYFQQQLAEEPVKETVSTALPPIAGLSFLPDVGNASHQVSATHALASQR